MYRLKNKSIYRTFIASFLVFCIQIQAQNLDNWFLFNDAEAGFSIKLPAEPNYVEDYETFKIYNYNDSDTRRKYSFFAIDMRHKQDIVADEALGDFITNIVKNVRGELENKKKLKVKNGAGYTADINLNSERRLKTQFTFANGFIYYQAVEDFKNESDAKTIDRFLKSFTVSNPAEKEDAPWIEYVNDLGAFSLMLPVEANDISRVLPNPQDETGEPYKLNLFSSIDQKNGDTYLFRYNDLPTGFFMENPEEGFSSIVADLSTKAAIIGEPKTIYLDGYPGREIELLLNDTYHAFARFYLRGNRTYFLLHQKIRPSDKVSLENNRFFESFKLKEFQKPDLFDFTPEGANFKILFSNVSKKVIDSTEYNLIDYKDTYDYYTTMAATGDMYLLEYNNVDKYFRIDSLSGYYDTIKDDLVSWNDSIVKQETRLLDGKEALFFKVLDKDTKVTTYHQIWLDNNALFNLNAYVEQEDETLDKIFTSYKKIENLPEMDYFSSKAKLIRDDLKETDSLLYNKALAAFNYYEFKEDEIPVLYEIINTDYKTDKKNEEIYTAVVTEFENINDSLTVKTLEQTYRKSNSDLVKSTILSSLGEIGSNEATELQENLLFTNPPETTHGLTWSIINNLTDSLATGSRKLEKLMGLYQYKDYRSSLLDMAKRMYDSDSLANNISEYQSELLKYVSADYEDYKQHLQDTVDYDYSHYSLISSYLNYIKAAKIRNKETDFITQDILDKEEDEWHQLLALTTRIETDLPSDKEYVSRKMDSLYWRYELMEAFYNAGKFEEIPQKYLKPEAFAELSLNNYLEYDDGPPSAMEILGHFKKDSETYYSISFRYDYDGEIGTPYLSVVGPVTKMSKSSPFRKFEVYTNWEEVEKDWKTQSSKLLLNDSN